MGNIIRFSQRVVKHMNYGSITELLTIAYRMIHGQWQLLG